MARDSADQLGSENDRKYQPYVILAKAGVHGLRWIPAFEGVAKDPEKKGTTNIHDDDWSPSVMKALATESRRHGGKAFFSSPCSVPPWQFSFTANIHDDDWSPSVMNICVLCAFVAPFFSGPFATTSFAGTTMVHSRLPLPYPQATAQDKHRTETSARLQNNLREIAEK